MLFVDPEFRTFVTGDAELGAEQAKQQASYEKAAEGSDEQARLLANLNAIREQRRSSLEHFVKPGASTTETKEGGETTNE